MAKYFAFFVFGCAFAVGVAGMVETHHHVSNAAPQFAGYQNVQ